MFRPKTRFSAAFCLLSVTLAACKGPTEDAQEKQAPLVLGQKEAPSDPREVPPGMLGGFKPSLPAEFLLAGSAPSSERVNLGKMLYFEPRLSKNHDVSCTSCHALDKFGVDGLAVSVGHKKQVGARNAPTVYNAAAHFVQFWDGRASDVEQQATGPVLNPVEMAMPDEERVVRTLESIPAYKEAFARAFPGEEKPVSLANAGRAMGAFERKLVTRAPWDDFLDGKVDALTAEQKAGFSTFMNTGCSSCHNGTLLGGNSFQKVGAVKPWPNQKDKGKFELSKNATDEMMFKVPSLRNVAQTGPYFHDGSVSKLEEAVKMMAEHQLGRPLSDADAASIVTFLGALTGRLPSDLIQPPELPKSTAKTPKPDPT